MQDELSKNSISQIQDYEIKFEQLINEKISSFGDMFIATKKEFVSHMYNSQVGINKKMQILNDTIIDKFNKYDSDIKKYKLDLMVNCFNN